MNFCNEFFILTNKFLYTCILYKGTRTFPYLLSPRNLICFSPRWKQNIYGFALSFSELSLNELKEHCCTILQFSVRFSFSILYLTSPVYLLWFFPSARFSSLVCSKHLNFKIHILKVKILLPKHLLQINLRKIIVLIIVYLHIFLKLISSLLNSSTYRHIHHI